MVAEAATLKYASPAAFPSVKSFSSATLAVIPPDVAVKAIAPELVPCEFVTTIVSDDPAFVDKLIPPVPAFTVTEVVDVVLPRVNAFAEASVPKLIVLESTFNNDVASFLFDT